MKFWVDGNVPSVCHGCRQLSKCKSDGFIGCRDWGVWGGLIALRWVFLAYVWPYGLAKYRLNGKTRATKEDGECTCNRGIGTTRSRRLLLQWICDNSHLWCHCCIASIALSSRTIVIHITEIVRCSFSRHTLRSGYRRMSLWAILLLLIFSYFFLFFIPPFFLIIVD